MTQASVSEGVVRRLARSLAFAIAGRRQGALGEIRKQLWLMIRDHDLRDIDKSSPMYASGAYDAFSLVISALEEQTLPEETRSMLLRRANVLNVVAANPGAKQKRLAMALEIAESNLTHYLRELSDAGLIERAVPSEGSGHAWALTPWGRKAWDDCAADPAAFQLDPDQVHAARVVLGEQTAGTAPAGARVGLESQSVNSAGLAEATDTLKAVFERLNELDECGARFEAVLEGIADLGIGSAAENDSLALVRKLADVRQSSEGMLSGVGRAVELREVVSATVSDLVRDSGARAANVNVANTNRSSRRSSRPLPPRAVKPAGT